MRKFVNCLAVMAIAVAAEAQTDSLANGTKELREVVVKSDVAMTAAEKATYFPTRRQRNAATDAVGLLQNMMITQLRVNPNSLAVSTLSGEDVTIFIDFMPATAEDLQGMNTQDVKRVEVYDFPSDVRFQGKAHVVNFVMQRYEIGGYTKLASNNRFLSDFSSNNSIYSKLAYKNWTLDANVSGRFSYQKHLGSEAVETFLLPAQTITRTENFADGKQRNRQASASLRATFQNKRMQLSNRLELLDKNTPTQEMFGSVFYSPNIYNPATSVSRQDSRSLTPTYKGDWNFMLPKQWMLSVKPNFQYSRNEQNRFYQEGAAGAIEHRVKEDAHNLEWEVALGKTFAKKHSLFLGTFGLEYGSEMDYGGSTVARQKMSFLALGFPLIYKFGTQRLNVSAQIIPAYQRNTVNGKAESEWSPIINSSATYAFNQKNSIEAVFNVSRSAADGADRNPSVLQKSEILYYSGNPLVGNFNTYNAKLTYIWMPSNLLSASVYAQHILEKDCFAKVWRPYRDDAILQTLDNVGDLHTTNIGASMTLRLLDGSLQFNAYPCLSIVKSSGVYDERKTVFNLDLRASYYVGQFNFHGGLTTPERRYYRDLAGWQRDRTFYYLTAGWGNAHWKAKLDIVNPFRTDWRDTRTIISSPVYSQVLENFNSSSRQRINLTLTHILNYGKKVRQGNELGTASGGQSSIL